MKDSMPHSSSVPLAPATPAREEHVPAAIFDRPIGQLLCLSRGLRPADVEQILLRQREHGGRFGEVAIALGLATPDDILEVLARQFEYPFVRSFDDQALDEELVCARDPLGEDAQSFRELRTELLAGVLSGQPRALAVLSPARGEGRTYVAANLAIAFAQLGGRTLLVDADMRSPRQHAVFGVDNPVGLSQLLCGRVVYDVVRPAPRISGLFLIGAGPTPPNPTELVHRGLFASLLRQWLADFDHVVLDTPAASSGPDGRVAAAAAGAALVVAQPQATRMAGLQHLLESVGKGPASLAGVVFNEH
jgi:chain length determinant protein tyrosine kinase EpsG